MLKIGFFIVFIISQTVSAASNIEIGYGSGELEGQSVHSTHIHYSYDPESKLFSVFRGDIGYSFGLRVTNYTSNLFQASDIETEFLEDVNILSQNIFGEIYYRNNNLKLGFNIDLFGISNSSSSKIKESSQKIKNETTNIFLWAENDKGTLNSQFFAAYYLSTIYVKAGLSHSLITFEDTGLSGDKNRQRFFDLGFLALGYNF